MPQLATLAAIAIALVTLTPTAGSAQGHGDHLMVAPADLKWADVPSLPPGAKIAVIEGPMNEAKPFTMRLRLPADYRIPAHFHSAIEHVTVISGTFNMAGSGAGQRGDHAPRYATLRLDEGRDRRPGTRRGAVDGHLRQPGGRPPQKVATDARAMARNTSSCQKRRLL